MNISIIIPTRNRLNDIKKILDYYRLFEFEGKIFFLDSSNKKIFLETKKLIKKYKNRNIKHCRLIGRPFECVKKILPKIKTKYVCLSGDDDFYIIEGLKKVVKILNTQKKIDAINGLTITARILKEKYIIKRYSIYKNFFSKDDKPINRLVKILNDYKVPIFSIFRSYKFKKAINYVPEKKNRNLCPSRIIHDEILEGLLLIFFNKIYKYDFPLLLRTVPQKKYAESSALSMTNKIKLNKSQKKSFNYLKNLILNLLKNHNDKFIFKKNFNKFTEEYIKTKPKYLILLRAFKMQFEKFYAKTINNNFKIFFKLINWLEKN